MSVDFQVLYIVELKSKASSHYGFELHFTERSFVFLRNCCVGSVIFFVIFPCLFLLLNATNGM